MVQYDFSGRTAVVTGGAKGIGLGIAQRLAGAGAWRGGVGSEPGFPAQRCQRESIRGHLLGLT